MSKEFIHNLEEGSYCIIDPHQKSQIKVTPYGDEVSVFKINFTGFRKGSERRLCSSQRENLSYAPHQNKFYGYCQFPKQKLNQRKITESRIAALQLQYSQPVESNADRMSTKPQSANNTKPQTACLMNGKQLNVKHSELLFSEPPNHLSANMQDVAQNFDQSVITSFNFRKGCATINKKTAMIGDKQHRFVSKYINHRQINSPPIKLINKFIGNKEQQKLQYEQISQTENHKKTLATDRGRLQIDNEICDDKQNKSLSKSQYHTIDLSLQMDTIQGNYMKSINTDLNSSLILCDRDNHKANEVYQSLTFKSGMPANKQKQLVTAKQLIENSYRLDKELELYPQTKKQQELKKPKQYKTKINTEIELSKNERHLNTNYLF